jgi:hypothetical protein
MLNVEQYGLWLGYIKKILVKEGVVLREINPWFLSTCQRVMELGNLWNYSPTITSLFDGIHMKGSRHYQHLAMDLRSWDLPTSLSKKFHRDNLKLILGEGYDVILENEGHSNEHLLSRNEQV